MMYVLHKWTVSLFCVCPVCFSEPICIAFITLLSSFVPLILLCNIFNFLFYILFIFAFFIVIPIGEWIWDTKVPVGAVWKLLPWNKGRAATCNIKVVYADSDFRIMADNDKELFVYTRPVCSRPQ